MKSPGWRKRSIDWSRQSRTHKTREWNVSGSMTIETKRFNKCRLRDTREFRWACRRGKSENFATDATRTNALKCINIAKALKLSRRRNFLWVKKRRKISKLENPTAVFWNRSRFANREEFCAISDVSYLGIGNTSESFLFRLSFNDFFIALTFIVLFSTSSFR